MAKSVKYTDNTYIDSSGVSHNRENLKTKLNTWQGNIDYLLNQAANTQHFYDNPTWVDGTKYTLLATIPYAELDTSQGVSVRLHGVIGGFESAWKMVFDVVVANRGGPAIRGMRFGDPLREDWGWFDLVVTKDENEHLRVYYKCRHYNGPANIHIEHSYTTWGTFETTDTPIGTEILSITDVLDVHAQPTICLWDANRTYSATAWSRPRVCFASANNPFPEYFSNDNYVVTVKKHGWYLIEFTRETNLGVGTEQDCYMQWTGGYRPFTCYSPTLDARHLVYLDDNATIVVDVNTAHTSFEIRNATLTVTKVD